MTAEVGNLMMVQMTTTATKQTTVIVAVTPKAVTIAAVETVTKAQARTFIGHLGVGGAIVLSRVVGVVYK